MQKLKKYLTLYRTNHEMLSLLFPRAYVNSLWVLLLAGTMMLSGCGGGGGLQNNQALSGNWQFTVASPADQSFLGGCGAGFCYRKTAR